ncbi:MAG: YicC family protein [Proteobacteria bacterium]|nr:YicC family protein [Cystobacterineae bacterium]MCL2313641.1 YicC family protein [Pseudomonadota bacterium]
MILSMTGFGAAKALLGAEELLVELRSVNHKYCDIRVRLPKELAACEAPLVRFLKAKLSRGAIEVFVKHSQESVALSSPQADFALLQSYRKLFEEMRQVLGAPLELNLKDWLLLPGVLKLEETPYDTEVAAVALQKALEEALGQLLEMRRAEGEAICVDIRQRLSNVGAHVQKLETLSASAIQDFRSRLEARLSELLATPMEPQRLMQEVVVFAERTDVAEELTRLKTHCMQMETLLGAGEPVGRRLDFLLQEMGREINTIGSKSQHSEISLLVIEVKAELERIREQVQNVE